MRWDVSSEVSCMYLNFNERSIVILSLPDFTHERAANYSINRPRDNALQVERFGDADEDGMIARLNAPLDDLQAAARVRGGFGDDLLKRRFAHVVRARAGDERTIGVEQFEGA